MSSVFKNRMGNVLGGECPGGKVYIPNDKVWPNSKHVLLLIGCVGWWDVRQSCS